jgi:transposase
LHRVQDHGSPVKLNAGRLLRLDGNRRRLGHITRQGSSRLRFLLVEAAQSTVRSLPEWRSRYSHLMLRRGRKIAKVAMARRLPKGTRPS